MEVRQMSETSQTLLAALLIAALAVAVLYWGLG